MKKINFQFEENVLICNPYICLYTNAVIKHNFLIHFCEEAHSSLCILLRGTLLPELLATLVRSCPPTEQLGPAQFAITNAALCRGHMLTGSHRIQGSDALCSWEPGSRAEQGKVSLGREVMLAGSWGSEQFSPLKKALWAARSINKHTDAQRAWPVHRRVGVCSGSTRVQAGGWVGKGQGAWWWAHYPVRECFFLAPARPFNFRPFLQSRGSFWCVHHFPGPALGLACWDSA